MPASIGVNLRVTGHCRQGGRKYMEDFFSVAYQQTEDERDLEYAFFGIYDGHGGAEAAAYAKEHLMELIVRQKNFWSDNDEDVLKAIKEGYIATHYAMWREQAKWPKTASGLPSTAGTTASIAFIRRGKIYIGHVGDSGIVLGYQESDSSDWQAKPLTKDHKPESAGEIQRIEQCGGKVVSKSGVPRVVWNRPRLGHQGPIRRSTPIDEIPFLAVARSLGDLWSYNSQLDEFVVSPDPDCIVIPIDTNTFRCLIFGTDGLYNMLSPQMAVHIVQQAEKHNENAALSDDHNKVWINPSKCLVEKALERWSTTKMRADNTSVITLLLDPPGPPRAQVLQNRKRKAYPDSGLEIVTRYEGDVPTSAKRSCINNIHHGKLIDKNIQVDLQEKPVDSGFFSASDMLRKMSAEYALKNSPGLSAFMQTKHSDSASSTENADKSLCEIGTSTEDLNENFIPKTRESTSYDVRDVNKSGDCNCSSSDIDHAAIKKQSKNDESVQINEISSSSNEDEEHVSIGSDNKNKKIEKPKKIIEQTVRPVLRSRNIKNLEQKKSPKDVKNELKMDTRQRNSSLKNSTDSEAENHVNSSRQLRVRNSKQVQKEITAKRDQNQNVNYNKSSPLSSKPGTSSGTKLEWLSVTMFRSIIRNKALNSKKANVKKVKERVKHSVSSKHQEKIDDSLRRSSRHSGALVDNTEYLKKPEGKSRREEIVVKKKRGRPQKSTSRIVYQPVTRSSRSGHSTLKQNLQRWYLS